MTDLKLIVKENVNFIYLFFFLKMYVVNHHEIIDLFEYIEQSFLRKVVKRGMEIHAFFPRVYRYSLAWISREKKLSRN